MRFSCFLVSFELNTFFIKRLPLELKIKIRVQGVSKRKYGTGKSFTFPYEVLDKFRYIKEIPCRKE